MALAWDPAFPGVKRTSPIIGLVTGMQTSVLGNYFKLKTTLGIIS